YLKKSIDVALVKNVIDRTPHDVETFWRLQIMQPDTAIGGDDRNGVIVSHWTCLLARCAVPGAQQDRARRVLQVSEHCCSIGLWRRLRGPRPARSHPRRSSARRR